MYVFWEHTISDGVQRTTGAPKTRFSKSSIHLADHYTTLRTACNMRIPVGAEQTRAADVDSLPKDRIQCRNCFK